MNFFVDGSETVSCSFTAAAADYKMESAGTVRILSSPKKPARCTEPHLINVPDDSFLKQKIFWGY